MNIILRDIYFNKLCASCLIPNKLRKCLYKIAGIKIGKGVKICPHCFIGNGNVEIGENTFLNYNVWLNTASKIKIGSRCNIAMKVTFITSTHEIGDVNRRAGESVSSSINVGNGCWIGANSIILPGVNIGDGVIIAAGSVVNSDLTENCLYAGVPAKKIKELK